MRAVWKHERRHALLGPEYRWWRIACGHARQLHMAIEADFLIGRLLGEIWRSCEKKISQLA